MLYAIPQTLARLYTSEQQLQRYNFSLNNPSLGHTLAQRQALLLHTGKEKRHFYLFHTIGKKIAYSLPIIVHW